MLIAKFWFLAMFDIVFITFTKNIYITLMQIFIIVKIFFSNLLQGLYFASLLSIRPTAVLQFLSVIAYDENFLFR
jgi:hypothetical protein